MKFNSGKARKIGKYSTLTMSLKTLLKKIKEGKVLIPREQRKMENKASADYKKKATAFVANLLLHVFCDYEIDQSWQDRVTKLFGDDIVIENGVPQFIGLSIDAENGYIYLSDGQHRFLHYLQDFINGDLKIYYTSKFGNDFTTNAVKSLFDNCVELEDGDGNTDENKYISYTMLSEADVEALMNVRIIAAVVDAVDEDERAALFIAMNSCTPIKQHDLANAAYGKHDMWQAITSVHDSLAGVDCDKDEPLTLENGQQYTAHEAHILKQLFYGQISTFVPMVSHAGLLTYLSKKQRHDYQWLSSDTQTQVEQVSNFFKATEKMNREECDKMLVKIMNDMIKIGHNVYEDRLDVMKQARGLKSLTVGQLHSLNTSGLSKKEFYNIASEITFDIIRCGYTPAGSNHLYGVSYFNNAHRSRRKNEKFGELVLAVANGGVA